MRCLWSLCVSVCLSLHAHNETAIGLISMKFSEWMAADGCMDLICERSMDRKPLFIRLSLDHANGDCRFEILIFAGRNTRPI